tara:strand:+ start:13028 stop:14542 length:1515 start_codon:yes stop_codon:yes gene_type:complete
MKFNILLIFIFVCIISKNPIIGQCSFDGNLNVSPNDSICSGDSYNLFATGASSYNWTPDSLLINSNVPFPSTINLTQTVTFVVTVLDNSGCSTVDSVEIFIYTSPIVSAGNDTTVCPGDTLQLNAVGGEDYIWSNDDDLSNLLINNPIAIPTESTVYKVEVIDSNNCKTNDSIAVNVFNNPNANAGFDINICNNQSHLLEGSGGVSFHWEPEEYINHPDSSSALCFPPDDMEFTLDILDSNGCADSDTVQILVFKIRTSNDTTICSGDSIQLTILGDPSTDFIWSPNINISDSSSSDPWVSPTEMIKYEVTASNSLGCTYNDDIIINISNIESVIDSTLVVGCDGFYVDFINSSSDDLNYKWIFSDNSQSNEYVVEKRFDFDSSIEAKLVVENDLGCKDSSLLNITSLNFESIFNFDTFIPPNTFTPNGDGLNDLYELNLPGRINECVSLNIYNKWGEIQFSSIGNNIYWDGFTNTGIPASQGIYFYTLNLKNKTKSGFLQLFR